MTLRKKSFLIVAGTALALLVSLYAAGRRIILDTALELERETLSLDLVRVAGALDAQADRLWRMAGDWATWDDTYAFVQDRNEAYARANLTDQALGNLDVAGVIFLDTAGKRVAEKFNAALGEAEDRLMRDLSAFLAANPVIVTGRPAGVRGILPLGDRTLLLAARPIVHSDQSGPLRGTLVFAQPLEVGQVARATRVAFLDAALRPIDDRRVPQALREPPAPGDLPPMAVVPYSFRRVGGFVAVEALGGNSSLALELVELRAVYVQGVRSLSYFIGALGLSVLCFGLVVGGLLERQVLSRLSRLSASVHGIGGASDLSRRVAVAGGDEIAALGIEVNAMLARLEEAHTELRRSRDQLEERVRERTAELETAKEGLVRQNRDLRAVDRMKDALIGDVSHELRTPVAKQAMQLELLRGELERRGLQDDLASMLRVMDGALRRQQSVIRNILTLSHLEAGGRGLILGPVRLDEIVAEVLDDYREVLDTCGIAVGVEVPELTVHTDRELLWHVLSNLVSNAVKYRGRVAPRVEIAASREDSRVRIRVTDNGVGFGLETRARIFERFYQESAAIEGIGLGLHIVKTVLDRIGGTITIDSPGREQGTVAEMVLPLETAAPAGQSAGVGNQPAPRV